MRTLLSYLLCYEPRSPSSAQSTRQKSLRVLCLIYVYGKTCSVWAKKTQSMPMIIMYWGSWAGGRHGRWFSWMVHTPTLPFRHGFRPQQSLLGKTPGKFPVLFIPFIFIWNSLGRNICHTLIYSLIYLVLKKQYFTRSKYVSFGCICMWLLVPLGERCGGNYTYNKLGIYVPYKEWGWNGRTPEYIHILPQLRIRNSSKCLTDLFHGWTIFRNQNFSAGCAHGCRGIIASWHAQ